jgi:hypothetical protein
MANPKVKRFFNPHGTAAEWIAANNPTLAAGEIGILIGGGGLAEDMKVGPGAWDVLESIFDITYPYTDLVTNEIGDILIGEDRSGDALTAMLRDMISPYVAPVISSPRNNAVGAATTNAILKIGQTVDTSVIISYTLNALGIPNLLPTNNISITSLDSIFNNEGLFTHGTGSEVLTLISQLIAKEVGGKPVVSEYGIEIFAKGTDGDTAAATTKIIFYPEILFGNSSLSTLLASEVAALAQRVTTNSYKRTYSFSNSQYHYIAIPNMLNVVSPVFTDVTNPNAPITMSFLFMQNYINLNNGTGVYDYALYRSEQLLLTPKVVIIS